MPTLNQTATATTTTTAEVVLAPKLRKRLQLKLQEYAILAKLRKALTLKLEGLTNELGALRDESGEVSINLVGYGTITLVAGTYKKFNPKTFVRLGGELSIYNEAMEDKPKKAYNKVTVPGNTEENEEE